MATAGPSHTTPNPPLNARSNRVADEGVAVTEDEPHVIQDLFDKTLRLLNEKEFQSADPRTFKGLKKRLETMRDAGLPRMKLLPGKVLEELGRIPRSTELRDNGEPYTVDALEIIEQEMIEREEKKGKKDKGISLNIEMPSFVLAFFSHRWLQANYSTLHQRDVEWGSAEWEEARQADGHYVGMPDNGFNDKARDLIEWMKWIKWRTEHQNARLGKERREARRKRRKEGVEGKAGPDNRMDGMERGGDCGLDTPLLPIWRLVPEIMKNMREDRRRRQTHLVGFLNEYVTRNCKDIYFFIDWSCVDQTNPMAEIAALPAFVSSCSMIASYWTEEYKGRAWCQAELLVARAFCAMPFVMRVTGGFKHEEQLHVSYQEHLLPDPSNKDTAMITDEKDRPTIQGLTECARKSTAFTYAQCSRNIGKSYGRFGFGNLLVLFSVGTMPLLLRRSVEPGKSKMHLVEPCADKPPKSWRRFRLWLQLNPTVPLIVMLSLIIVVYIVLLIVLFDLTYLLDGTGGVYFRNF